MNTLEHDLDVIEGEFGDILSSKPQSTGIDYCKQTLNTNDIAVDQLYFRAARLHLYAFHWLNPSLTEQRRIGILKAYTTATAFITQTQSANASSNILTYCPIVIPRTLFASGCTLLKVLNSRFLRYVDFQAGVTIFQIAVTALRQCSVEGNDMSTHAANILAEIWQHRDDNPTTKYEEPTLSIKSRSSASIIADCLRRWKFHIAQANGITTQSNVSGRTHPARFPSHHVLRCKATSIGRQQPGISQIDNPNQNYDFSASGFDWDQELFNDLSWSWDFDVSQSTIA